jgi:hypothetical protein
MVQCFVLLLLEPLSTLHTLMFKEFHDSDIQQMQLAVKQSGITTECIFNLKTILSIGPFISSLNWLHPRRALHCGSPVESSSCTFCNYNFIPFSLISV